MPRAVIGSFELRKAAMKPQFAELFPEHRELFHSYWNKPGCGDCWRSLLQALSLDQDRIRSFFGDVDVDLGVAPPPRAGANVSATTVVLTCRTGELQAQVDRLCEQNAGAKSFALARWMDEVTAVVNIVDVPAPGAMYVVVNSTVRELSGSLNAVDDAYAGPKQHAVCRYEDKVTAVVTVF